MKIKHWNSFSAMNASQSEGKFAYFKLNGQMPCLPRSTVPVNTKQDMGKFFIAVPAGSLSVMAATALTMWLRILQMAVEKPMRLKPLRPNHS